LVAIYNIREHAYIFEISKQVSFVIQRVSMFSRYFNKGGNKEWAFRRKVIVIS